MNEAYEVTILFHTRELIIMLRRLLFFPLLFFSMQTRILFFSLLLFPQFESSQCLRIPLSDTRSMWEEVSVHVRHLHSNFESHNNYREI